MKKSMIVGAALLAAGVSQAAIIGVTQTDYASPYAGYTAPAGMSVVKAVNFAGTADVLGGVAFEADAIVGAVGNGYTTTGDFTQEGAGTLNSSFVNNGNDGFVIGNTLTLVADTDYAFDLFVGTAHNVRNSTLNYTLGAESGSEAFDQVDIDLRVVRVVFNSGSETEFDWNVGNVGTGGFHSKLAGYAVYAVPEPATLGLVAVFGGGVLFIRRRFMI